MPGLLPHVDPNGLLEYSVVYTDRSLNHMSKDFQTVMRDISRLIKEVYHAHSAVLVPGSGTFGMEAVARQFATDKPVLVSAMAGSATAGPKFLKWGASRPRARCSRPGA
jgi:alanine-glyoxylate transaminase / serine-glyoxylate transaminase / serine-pyruvate transaminase